MTATSTVLMRDAKVTVPFAVAFGVMLSVSTAACVPMPTFTWTSTTPAGEQIESARYAATSSGSTSSTAIALKVAAPAESVAELRLVSGLTIDQISRLLGVSRRSVHNWMTGNAMASFHQERVSYLLSVMYSLAASSPDERRIELLGSHGGPSLFHQMLAQRSESTRVQQPVGLPRDRLG